MGGVHHNNIHGADFIYENLQIQNNLIHGSFMNNVKKLFFSDQAVYIQKV